MKRLTPLAALLVLAGCQPPHVEGAACDAGGRLGFALGETAGWFGSSPARPKSVTVMHIGGGEQVWNSRAPDHGLIARMIGAGEPQRPILLYGAALPGWMTSEPAASLLSGEHYWAHIWTDGGMATIEWTQGAKLPACPGSAGRLAPG
ncbi:hypothetical protein [Sphingomonas jatrophae]|uniref:Uncharacterized protein n=1 Tax=Sphingomonas jatrophae TaxID=1166337 RepID=A0A1I6K1M5_9SPHN|nr:hypothetical protein [Sphingomonas jatrophae]SFR85067.1 hypothetical protein SAMN05192580_1215 [Sphingomonas jatrophae]